MNHLFTSEKRIPRDVQHFFIFASLLFIFASMASAGEKNEEALYAKELSSPQVINNFEIGDEAFRSLTAAQKLDLLEAKKHLVSFFRAFGINIDLPRFLGRDLLAKYKSRCELLNKFIAFIGEESQIDTAIVTGFEFGKDGVVNLRYYLIVFVEGTLVLDYAGSARLKKQGSYWKIMSIYGL